jgi:hypothetical protein
MKVLFFIIFGVGMGGWKEAKAQIMVSDRALEAAIRMYGEPVLSANPDLLNSTSNDVGPWGSPDSYYSLTNDYGPLGSPDFLHGVANDLGQGLEVEIPAYGAKPMKILISANPDLYLSTANDYGPAGAPESYYSVNNDYGPNGAPEMLHGAANDYGEGLKIRFSETPLDAPLELDAP